MNPALSISAGSRRIRDFSDLKVLKCFENFSIGAEILKILECCVTEDGYSSSLFTLMLFEGICSSFSHNIVRYTFAFALVKSYNLDVMFVLS